MANSALIGPWIRRFLLEHLVMERNLSINTQRSYRDTLIQLLPFLAEKARTSTESLKIDDFSAKRVSTFLSYLEANRRCSTSTRNQRLSAIRALARFVAERAPEYIDWYRQLKIIPIKRAMQPGITCLDRDEMKALLNAPVQSTAQGRRDYAVLIFLYNSGARVSEAAHLTIADLDWHAHSVRLLGKGNKVRVCPLWPRTLEALRPLTARRDASARVFLNRYHRPMTRSGIHSLVKRYAVQACRSAPSIAKKTVGPHVIRHSSASNLLRAGVDINTIRGWLGHKSLDTTHIYAEIDLDTKARALAACAFGPDKRHARHWRKHSALLEFMRTL